MKPMRKFTAATLRKRVLLPLAGMLLTLWAIFMLSTFWAMKKDIEAEISHGLEHVDLHLQSKIGESTQLLTALISRFQMDRKIMDAMQAGDRDALASLARPIFKRWKSDYMISHLYFADARNGVLLRAHDPERFGDTLKHRVIALAAGSGQPKAALEIGSHGNFALRVATPLRQGGRLLGFIELGINLSTLVNRERFGTHTDIYLVLYKKNLDRKAWQERMRLLGRDSQWERFPSVVFAGQNGQEVPVFLGEALAKKAHTHMRHYAVRDGSKYLRIGFVPLFDASGEEAGDAVIVSDVTQQMHDFFTAILMIAIAGLALGLPVFGFIYWLLGRAQAHITHAGQELEQSEQRFRELAENIHEVFWITTPDMSQVIYISPGYETVWGRSCKDLYAAPHDWIEAIHADDQDRVLEVVTRKQLSSGEYDEEYRIVRPDGAIRWIRDRAFPVRDESGTVYRIAGVADDITEVVQARSLERLRRQLMEIILSVDSSLGDILRRMILEVEKEIPAMMGSILLMDGEGRHLRHGAAPSLPDGYNMAVDGVAIGPRTGSCGTAAFRGERVIVSDIATDPLWEDYRELALSHDLAACWSEPVMDESGKVLGTFAMYYREQKTPHPFELNIIELATGLAAIAIERKQTEAERQQRASRVAAEHEATAALALSIGGDDCPLNQALGHICEVAADVIGVERTSVWRLSDDGKELRCLNLFERTSGEHSSGAVLKASEYPAYFKAIESSRALTAHDARNDPNTCEFRDGYLIPLDIHSMLDAVVRVEGKLFGMICLEHTQSPRRWHDDEVGFAGAVSDQVVHALLSEQNRQATADMELAATVFSASPMGTIITDEHTNILRVNTAFTDITGYSAEEAVGQKPAMLKSGRHDEAFYQNLWTSLKDTGRWEGEIWNRRKSGDVYPQWESIVAVKNSQRGVSHYIASFTDITEKKLSEKHVYRLAHYDALTNLPNRTLLQDRLSQAIAQAKRRDRKIAVLFFDLDNFKLINDTMGHVAGDVLLQLVAGNLNACVREEDTVARLGGDEFVVVLSDITSVQDVAGVTEKILSVMREPLPLEDREVNVSFSIGVSLYPDDGLDGETLLKRADIALYRAKEGGKDRAAFFTLEMTLALEARQRLEEDMKLALEKKQFVLYYQPQIDLSSGRVTGVEALIRWVHPERGVIPPFEFIPVAEETGLILSIGRWVLEEACRQQHAWKKKGVNIRMAINLSARQLQDEGLLNVLACVLEAFAVEPGLLELELTETCLMDDPEDAVRLMQDIKNLGLRLAMDDFGTGYSSLSYLKRFAMDTLKIDQSFVRNLPGDGQDAAIATTIITMGHNLGMNVLAEGVETEEQLKFLQEHGCDEVQGYYFSKPLPVEEIQPLLQRKWRI